jgi:hypothetical protein
MRKLPIILLVAALWVGALVGIGILIVESALKQIGLFNR